MYGYLWAVGAATVLVVGAVSYAMTRRYGWGAALALPVLALVVVVATRWQEEGLLLDEGMHLIGASLVFSSPILLGALAGIVIARLRKG